MAELVSTEKEYISKLDTLVTVSYKSASRHHL